ncbi:beta strand repeat-containing protein [Halorubrum sp. N11]|uniref:beta strand repeat-containing protein n=1 Tax=Halorubrum sp. N11 TaxID=3402276 RepID=UPI003EC0EC19
MNADDSAGLSITDKTYTFYVDNTGPDATGVTVDNVRESTETAYVNVTFANDGTVGQQDVDPSTIEAAVNVDGNQIETVDNFAYDADNTRYYGTLDLSSGNYDGIENMTTTLPYVNVTAAQDDVGNELTDPASGESEATFNIDTDGPTVNVESPGQDLGGYVNFTSLVTTSDTASSTVEVLVGEDPNSVFTIGTLTDARDIDTTGLPDGTHTLRVSVDDDANPANSDTDTATFTLDNQQAVDVQQPYLAGTTGDAYEVDGQFNLSTDVFATPADADVTYQIDDGSGFTEVSGSELQFDADDYNDGDTVTLSATANGFTATTEVKVVAVKEIDYGVAVGTEDEPTADNPTIIALKVNSKLNSLSATVADTDAHFSDETVDVSGIGEGGDFTYVGETSPGTYVYTASMPSSLRDGQYQVTVNEVSSATQTRDLGATSSLFTIDNNTPTITDADISGVGTDGRTQVRVQFSEPVNVNEGTVEGITASDGTAVNDGIDVDGSDGEVVVEFNDVLQTGDGLNVSYADGTIAEEFDVDDGDAAETNDGEITRMVDTVDLQLSEGQNLVSVPAETGTVALSDLNTEHVETVYAWDDGSWTGYTPGDDTSDLQNLEGGQGYVFTMSAADEIAVQAYNKPGAVEGGVAPMTDEHIEEGWNLIGHFQEAPQDRGTALMELDAATYDAAQVLGEESDGSYGPVAQFQPGEGYWLHADQTDNYAATPFDGSPVLSGLSVTGSAGTADVVAAANTETVSLAIDADDVDGVDTVEFDSSVDTTTATLTDDGTGTYTADVDIDTTGESGTTTLGTITVTDIVGDTSERTVTATVDGTAPTIESPTPADQTTVTDASQTYSVDISDATSGVDASSITVSTSDGLSSVGTDNARVSYDAGTSTLTVNAPSGGYTDGQISVTVNADDNAGNSATKFSSTFTVDTIAPAISSPTPADQTTVTDASQTYTVDISDATSGVDASSITVSTSGTTSGTILDSATVSGSAKVDYSGTTLTVTAPDGGYASDETITVTVNADDSVANSAQFSSTFTVDTTPDATSATASLSGDETSGQIDISADASSTEGGTIHYVIVSGNDADAPTASDVIAGNGASAENVYASGSSTALNAGETFSATNVATGQNGADLDVYFVQQASDGDTGDVVRADGTTAT